MTSKELLYVTTIAEETSVSRAAQKLFMTQPALSHCLSGIEQQLGQPLFKRSSRGLTLTYAGEEYCRTARKILRMYGDLEQKIGEIDGLKRGRVTVGMTRFLATGLLPKTFPEYRKRYPGVEFLLREESSAQLLELLTAQQLDLAVMNLTDEELEQPGSVFEYRKLHRDFFVIAAEPNSPLAALTQPGGIGGLPELDPAYLQGSPFIMVNPGQRIRRVVDRVLRQAGVAPEIVLTSSNTETARRVAASGAGVTMLPYDYTVTFSEGRGASYFSIPREYRAVLTVAAVRPRDGYLSQAANRFLEQLCETYQVPAAPGSSRD